MAIDGNGILDATFVDSGDIGSEMHNTKHSCTAWQQFAEYPGGAFVCFFIFGYDKWRSMNEYIFTQIVIQSFACRAVIVVFVNNFANFVHGCLLCSQGADVGFKACLEDLRRCIAMSGGFYHVVGLQKHWY